MTLYSYSQIGVEGTKKKGPVCPDAAAPLLHAVLVQEEDFCSQTSSGEFKSHLQLHTALVQPFCLPFNDGSLRIVHRRILVTLPRRHPSNSPL